MKIHKTIERSPKKTSRSVYVFHRKEFQRHVKHSIGVWEESDLFSSHQGKARERNPHKKCSLSFFGQAMNYVFPIVGRLFLFFFF